MSSSDSHPIRDYLSYLPKIEKLSPYLHIFRRTRNASVIIKNPFAASMYIEQYAAIKKSARKKIFLFEDINKNCVSFERKVKSTTLKQKKHSTNY
jgi:hypothetical protein